MTNASLPPPPTRRSTLYHRALFLLYAIPHVIAAQPTANLTDVIIISTRLCQALESTSSHRSADNAEGAERGGAASWEAQLVLTNVLIHLLFLDGAGKQRKPRKRILDVIFRWMEANSTLLPNFCPVKLKERLTKVLTLKKASF